LKPENILIQRNGYITLSDFGMQRLLKLKEQNLTSFFGSTEYLPPEVVRGKEQTFISDWWALGILM